ncbi:hypothetical protein K8I61_05865 [bacterium]|nr:hypothetical protein [bacterium]
MKTHTHEMEHDLQITAAPGMSGTSILLAPATMNVFVARSLATRALEGICHGGLRIVIDLRSVREVYMLGLAELAASVHRAGLLPYLAFLSGDEKLAAYLARMGLTRVEEA